MIPALLTSALGCTFSKPAGVMNVGAELIRGPALRFVAAKLMWTKRIDPMWPREFA